MIQIIANANGQVEADFQEEGKLIYIYGNTQRASTRSEHVTGIDNIMK